MYKNDTATAVIANKSTFNDNKNMSSDPIDTVYILSSD